MPDIARLRSVLRQIDAHPDQWCQQQYAIRYDSSFVRMMLRRIFRQPPAHCAYCVAGWTCVLAGYKVDWEHSTHFSSYLTNHTWIYATAKNLLEIDSKKASALFHGWNTRNDIEYIAEQIAASAGEPLWEGEIILCPVEEECLV